MHVKSHPIPFEEKVKSQEHVYFKRLGFSISFESMAIGVQRIRRNFQNGIIK